MGPEYWQTVEEALGIMGKGMLGIFVVIIIIAPAGLRADQDHFQEKVLTALKRKRTGSIPSFFCEAKSKIYLTFRLLKHTISLER